VIVDHLLATGGTASAGARLVTGDGARVVESAFVIEFVALGGRKRLAPTEVFSVLRF
jgi:adenine phosphoribosyltransferase